MRIAIFGGSFNPPHWGHIASARAVIDRIKPNKLIMITAKTPPHKELGGDSPGPDERLRMTALAAAEIPGALASDIELRRDGPSYTADTIRQLKRSCPQAELFLLIGTDMLLSFEKWYDFRYILSNAVLTVFARGEARDGEINMFADMLADKYAARVEIIDNIPYPAASTDIRPLLKDRRGRRFLPESVYEYIISRRLYQAKPELEWLREKSYSYLKKKRIAHVQGCEQEAVKLAGRWGCDPQDAAEAAILHDITKKISLDEQLILCEKYGIVNDDIELQSPKLLHGKTGAALAQELFGISDDVYQAIRWHTTGKPDMTVLEKVIYLADYIEPNRELDGIERLRALAYSDIDQAMILGLEMSLEDIRSNGGLPHDNTEAALQWLKSRKGR